MAGALTGLGFDVLESAPSKRMFRDRREAGRVLAGLLAAHGGEPDVVVLGLARGGVPVGWEVAAALRAPLDVFLVRKLGVPNWPELAMGAIAGGGGRIINDRIDPAAWASPPNNSTPSSHGRPTSCTGESSPTAAPTACCI